MVGVSELFLVVCYSKPILCYMVQHHTTQYPILAAMACDYFAIQVSSVPSKCAFSSGGINGTTLCNKLNTKTFEALQILKGGYKSGVLSSLEEARTHEPKQWMLSMGGNGKH